MINYSDLIQYNWYRYALKGFTEVQKLKYGRAVNYYSQLVTATPKWADYDAILDIYLLAAKIRHWGCKVEVDHIIPVNHPHVCGLHCVSNLEIVSSHVNHSKSNHDWIDSWVDQMELF